MNFALFHLNMKFTDNFFNFFYRNTVFRIPENLAPVVYCSVVSEGAAAEWEFLWEKYSLTNTTADQKTILNALGCTQQGELIYVTKIMLLLVYHIGNY